MGMADRAEIDRRNVFTVDADLGGLFFHQGFQVELGSVTATILRSEDHSVEPLRNGSSTASSTS